ncbi:MAG: PH domain-containing protein [Actinomycetota bacterium]
MGDQLRDSPLPEVTWRRPSPRLRVMRRAEVAVPTGVVAAVAGTLSGISNGPSTGVIVASCVTALGVVVDRFVQRRVRAWGYCERDDDLLVQRGVVFARLSVVPYGRMQFIDVTAGPIERSFGLATVRMHTAAAATDARIPGLSRAGAADLRDHLATLGESRAAGL